MSNYLVKLLFKIIKEYSIPVTRHTIENEINTHPDSQSMQCISDALEVWKVKHLVMNLTLENLLELDLPVVAHLKRGEFLWVSRITKTNVYFWSTFEKKNCNEY